MKYYFLAFATVITVCVGCQSGGGDRVSARSGAARLSEADQVIGTEQIERLLFGYGHDPARF